MFPTYSRVEKDGNECRNWIEGLRVVLLPFKTLLNGEIKLIDFHEWKSNPQSSRLPSDTMPICHLG